MKAFVLFGDNDARMADVKKPEIEGPLDCIVRMKAVSTCVTDIHIKSHAMSHPGLIGKAMGHEGIGIIEEVGSDVKEFKPGDRILIPSDQSEFRSIPAQEGRAFLASKGPYFDMNHRADRGGCFSEYMYIYDPDMNCAHIPEGVTDEQALMYIDMGKTGLAAVQHANLDFGDTVAIFGIGGVGLMATAYAAVGGASRIICVGSRKRCVDLAYHYGATSVVNYKDGDVAEQIIAANNGQQVDRVLITGGESKDIFSTALRVLRCDGIACNVACYFEEEETIIQNRYFGYGGGRATIRFAGGKTGRAEDERNLRMISSGRIDPSLILTHTLHGFDNIETALKKMGMGQPRDPEVIKIMVVLDENM